MTHATLTITGPDGTMWTSDLCAELYALLLAEAMRMRAEPPETNRAVSHDIPLAKYAVTILEQVFLQRISNTERLPINQVLSVVNDTLTSTHERAVDRPSMVEAYWHVHGVVSYRFSGRLLYATAMIDCIVIAADWYAAETAALTKLWRALELEPDTQTDYTWAAGPDVTPLVK